MGNSIDDIALDVKHDEMFSYGIAKDNDVLVVQCKKNDLLEAEAYALEGIINSHDRHTVIDLANARYISSIAIGVFASSFFRLKSEGYDLTFCNISRSAKAILDAANFPEYMHMSEEDLEGTVNRYNPVLDAKIDYSGFEPYAKIKLSARFSQLGIKTNRHMLDHVRQRLPKPEKFWELKGHIYLGDYIGPECGIALYKHLTGLGITSFEDL